MYTEGDQGTWTPKDITTVGVAKSVGISKKSSCKELQMATRRSFGFRMTLKPLILNEAAISTQMFQEN
jgi:hypothetical protein